MDAQRNKQAALDWLSLVVAGRVDEAYARHMDPRGRHHNAFFPAGFDALREAQKESHQRFPAKAFVVQRTVAEGDVVAVHSRLQLAPGEPEMAVMHIFRFEGGKVAELWDLGQAAPKDMPNRDGLF